MIKFLKPELTSDGPYLVTCERPLSTEFGNIVVDIEIDSKPNDIRAIEYEMNGHFNKAKSHLQDAWAYVFKNYRDCSINEKWMKQCGVPIGLSINELDKYITDISFRGYWKNGRCDEVVLYFRPLWDTEHCIYLELIDGLRWLVVDC